MRPRLVSFALNSTDTRSPGNTLIWCSLILPDRYARVSLPSSNLSRNKAPGRASKTIPFAVIKDGGMLSRGIDYVNVYFRGVFGYVPNPERPEFDIGVLYAGKGEYQCL